MEYPEEISKNFKDLLFKIDPIIIDIISSKARLDFFEELRNLINQKQIENDYVAENVLGWAYEQLSK